MLDCRHATLVSGHKLTGTAQPPVALLEAYCAILATLPQAVLAGRQGQTELAGSQAAPVSLAAVCTRVAGAAAGSMHRAFSLCRLAPRACLASASLAATDAVKHMQAEVVDQDVRAEARRVAEVAVTNAICGAEVSCLPPPPAWARGFGQHRACLCGLGPSSRPWPSSRLGLLPRWLQPRHCPLWAAVAGAATAPIPLLTLACLFGFKVCLSTTELATQTLLRLCWEGACGPAWRGLILQPAACKSPAIRAYDALPNSLVVHAPAARGAHTFCCREGMAGGAHRGGGGDRAPEGA